MDLAEVVLDIRKRRAKLHAARDDLQKQLQAVVAEVAEIEAEYEVVQRLAGRYDLPIDRDHEDSTDPEIDKWRAMPRTTAVQQVLEDATGPLSPNDITRKLRERGRDDAAHNVSAALAHLKTTDRADTIGHARWVIKASLPFGPRDTEAPANAGASVNPDPLVQEGGGDSHETTFTAPSQDQVVF